MNGLVPGLWKCQSLPDQCDRDDGVHDPRRDQQPCEAHGGESGSDLGSLRRGSVNENYAKIHIPSSS